jgi:hypothetical protein
MSTSRTRASFAASIFHQASVAGIVSQRWEAASVDLNATLAWTREHHIGCPRACFSASVM